MSEDAEDTWGFCALAGGSLEHTPGDRCQRGDRTPQIVNDLHSVANLRCMVHDTSEPAPYPAPPGSPRPSSLAPSSIPPPGSTLTTRSPLATALPHSLTHTNSSSFIAPNRQHKTNPTPGSSLQPVVPTPHLDSADRDKQGLCRGHVDGSWIACANQCHYF